MSYLINFSILSRCVLMFHVSLSIIYQLYDLILSYFYRIVVFAPIKKVLLLKHHLIWYISYQIIFTCSCYLLLLPKQNQSAYLHLLDISIKFMINKEKNILRGDLCVLYEVMLWNNYFFPRMAFSNVLRVVAKKNSCSKLWW